MNANIRIIYCLYILFLFSSCGVGSVSTSTDFGVTDFHAEETDTAVITFSWVPPTTYTNNDHMSDLSGYKLYFGETPYNLELLTEIEPYLTSVVIENDPRLLKGYVYYFGITAFNSKMVESQMSEIVKFDPVH